MHGLVNRWVDFIIVLQRQWWAVTWLPFTPLYMAGFSVFPFLFILVFNPALMFHCPTNAAITRQPLARNCCFTLWPTQSIFHRLFLILHPWPSFFTSLFVAIHSSVRSELLTISSSLSLRCTSPLFLRIHYFIIVSSSSVHDQRFFRNFYISIFPCLFFHHCSFIFIRLSLLFRRHILVTCFSHHFFVFNLLSLLHSRQYLARISSSSFLRRHVFISTFFESWFRRSHSSHLFTTDSSSVFLYRSIVFFMGFLQFLRLNF